MPRYCRIENNAVVEIGAFDSIEGRFHDSLMWAESETAELGDIYSNGTFTKPVIPEKSTEQLMQEIVTATQQRLYDFAKTRNYDGILSACTYATSTVSKFQIEGQYCVNARDATWSTLYQLFDDVANGVTPIPASFDDMEPLLPVLEWPTA